MPPKYSEEIAKIFVSRQRPRIVQQEFKVTHRTFTPISAFLDDIRQIPMPKPEEIPDPPLPNNEARIRRRKKLIEANEKRISIGKENYHPDQNPNATKNPQATLFLGNLSPKVTEEQLRDEFRVFGEIESVKFVYDTITHERKPYAFLEYKSVESFRKAMAQGTRLRLDNQKVIVDCERARTVPGWYPRRLGGGEGGISRRFSKQIIVMQNSIPKRKKSTWKYGKRYKGNLAEFSRKRDERLGIFRGRRRKFGDRGLFLNQ